MLTKSPAQSSKTVSPIRNKLRSKTFKENFELTLLALPGLLVLFFMYYVPLPGLVLAFKNYNFADGVFGSPWVGFKNFKFIFSTQDALIAFRNTLLYNAAFMVTIIGGCLLLAILLSNIFNTKCLKAYQTAVFLPYFLSMSVI